MAIAVLGMISDLQMVASVVGSEPRVKAYSGCDFGACWLEFRTWDVGSYSWNVKCVMTSGV